MQGRTLLALAALVSRPGPRHPARTVGLAAALLLLLAPQAGAVCYEIICDVDVSVPSLPDQCGATASYGSPSAIVSNPGDCGAIDCLPASGAFFPVGPSTVTCTSAAGPSCQLGVTVVDTQPPQIFPPADVTLVSLTPGSAIPVNYQPSMTSDNCPQVVYNCIPPSGSAFPSGETEVECTATDTSGNPGSGSFRVRHFDACVEHDAGGEFVRWSTVDGIYEFLACGESACGTGGFLRAGTGEATQTSAGFGLRDRQDDRSVHAYVHTGKQKGKATLKFTTGGTRLSSRLKDTDLGNDACMCP